jgi:hypothetical protein
MRSHPRSWAKDFARGDRQPPPPIELSQMAREFCLSGTDPDEKENSMDTGRHGYTCESRHILNFAFTRESLWRVFQHKGRDVARCQKLQPLSCHFMYETTDAAGGEVKKCASKQRMNIVGSLFSLYKETRKKPMHFVTFSRG